MFRVKTKNEGEWTEKAGIFQNLDLMTGGKDLNNRKAEVYKTS